MGEAAHHGHGPSDMDMPAHQSTFANFMKATEWGTILIVALVALLTVCFAMGLGWFSGLLAFAAITIAAGLLMRMGAIWWVTIGLTLVLLGVGGGIVSLLVPSGKAAALALVAFA